ncbi:aminoglycoside 6'-N-acetyltransferase [Streptococcus pluranimalium]|uniref:aminoglycoside 6'-N-acetyltransferase n=1 Tax=Streptococcus pluranimalium TaxID=82348 RepID=UPI003F67598F
MIESVTKSNISEWAALASQLWSTSQESLVEEFLSHKFPYEFIYRKDGHVVAFMSLSIRQDYVEGTQGSPVAYLEGIFVLGAYQKLGIASRLLDFARSWAKKNGMKELSSDCSLENSVSQEFHQALGFREVSRSVHFVMKVD